MRTTTTIAFLFALTLFASTSHAFLTGVEYFKFDGWNHAIVTSDSGQTFNNILGDIDVVVTAFGEFDVDTSYVVPTTHPGGGWINTGGHPVNPGSHSLRFSFSEPLDLVVKSNTVDPEEELIVSSSSHNKYYAQHSGAPAVVTNPYGMSGNGLRVVGGGFSLDPTTGAAYGETVSEGRRNVTVTHRALVGTKYERIMVGAITVPEPNAMSLLMFGLLTLVSPFRRR